MRPSDAERAGVAQPPHRASQVAHGRVEVDGVEQVERRGHRGRGGGLALEVEHRVPVRQRRLLTSFRDLGIAAQQRLVDQRREVGRDPVAAAEDGCVPIDERDSGRGQGRGVLRDPAGPPRLQPARLHQLPEPGQPLLQLPRVGDEGQRRSVGDVEGGTERGHGPVGDRRAARHRLVVEQ